MQSSDLVTNSTSLSLSLSLYLTLCLSLSRSLSPSVSLAIHLLVSSSVVYIISAPASPVLGFIVDRTGKNVLWVAFAIVGTLAAHMMLAFTFWTPWIAMVTSPSPRLA